MKNTQLSHILIYVIINLILNNPVNAQYTGGWISQSIPYDNGLNDIKFFNENTGITVGYNGKILKTTNGGDNWIPVNNGGTQKNLISVSIISPSNIYIAGDSGVVLKSTDSGDSWVTLNSGTNKNLNFIVFKSSENGFAAGDNGTLIRTTNSGINWSGTFSDSSVDFYSMSFVNERFVWALGQKPDSTYFIGVGFMIKTTNMGINWNVVVPELTDFYDGKSIYFVDSLIGFCGYCSTVLDYGILRTSDGGLNWECLWGGFHNPNSIFFVNNSTGISVGNGNYDIQFTTNSGISWYTSLTAFPFPYLQSAFFINPLTGWVVGTQLLKTTTAGGLITNTIKESDEIPNHYSLYQNYPNPFNPNTKIKFDISKKVFVNMTIYNSLGKKVAELVNETLNPGIYEAEFKGENFDSGIYFCRLSAGNFKTTIQMALIK